MTMHPDDSSFEAPRRAAAPAPAQRSNMSPAIIVFGLLALAGLFFFLGNGETTQFHFLFWDWNTTVRWMILVSLLLGVILDRLFSLWWRRRKKRKARARELAED
jgi:uncharacterized integral membrane protein